MLADSKKVQSMINICATELEAIRIGVEVLNTIKNVFQAINPDVTGTPLEGKVAAVGQAISNLTVEASKDTWTQLIAAKVPSHRSKALEV